MLSLGTDLGTKILNIAIILLGVGAVGATVTLTASRQGAPLAATIAAGAVLAGVALLYGQKRDVPLLNCDRLARAGALWIVLGLGLAARLGYAVAVEPVQVSDAVTYAGSAAELAQTGEYRQHIAQFVFRSYLPPGYPAVLSLFLRTGLAATAAVLVANAVIFLVCGFGFYRLMAAWGLAEGQAIAALALFVLWPGMVPWFNLAYTDTLALCGLILAHWLAVTAKSRWGYFLSGCCLALAALTRGQFILFAGGILLYVVLTARAGGSSVMRRVLPFLAGLVLCWGPWVVRNYLVLGAVVPFSTNGGDILYRANNGLATGGYIEQGERNYWPLVEGEVQLYRMTTAWAVEWIKGHPGQFLQLMGKKFFLLLGEDHFGYYYSLRWPHPEERALYAGLQLLSNAWWLGAWMVILAGRKRILEALRPTPARVWMILAIPAVMVAVHSVFESGSRYHIPMLPVVILLLALSTARSSKAAV